MEDLICGKYFHPGFLEQTRAAWLQPEYPSTMPWYHQNKIVTINIENVLVVLVIAAKTASHFWVIEKDNSWDDKEVRWTAQEKMTPKQLKQTIP